MSWVFDTPVANEINLARLDHLESLGLPLHNKTVLEVGSGIGKHTHLFIKHNCDVVSTDGRSENIIELLRRYPGRHAEVVNLLKSGGHNHLGKFDIVYCYGVLYHLNDPALCIEELARLCTEIFLLESRVWPYNDNEIHLTKQHDGADQAMDGCGCQPSRLWIRNRLRMYYKYVYMPITQPNHSHYPLEWPPQYLDIPRAIFVASQVDLGLSALSMEFLMKQERYER